MALRLKRGGKEGLSRRNERTSKVGKTDTASSSGLQDDPYEFVDSQSLQPHSPKTPQAATTTASTRRETAGGVRRSAGKSGTPLSVKTQRTPVSVSRKLEIEAERLQQREREELECALEESRREMARVERRQRQLRREEAEEAEAREEEMEKTRVTEGVVSSSRRIEEALSSVSAAQSLTEVPIPTADVPNGDDDLSQSTPPLETTPNARTPYSRNGDDDLSQSTPPLETTPNARTPYSRPYTLERTPVIQVTKLCRRVSSGVHTPVKTTDTPVSVDRGRQTRPFETRQGVCEGKRGREGEGGRETEHDGCQMDEWMCETPPLGEEGEGGRLVGDRQSGIQQEVTGEVGEVLCEGVEMEVVGGSEGESPENIAQALHPHSGDEKGGREDTGNLAETSPEQHKATHVINSGFNPKKGPLLLSLKKGKKRASGGVSGQSPSSKKTRVSVDHSACVTGGEAEGHEASNASRPSHFPSSFNSTAQPQTSKTGEMVPPPVVSDPSGAGRRDLPELFAPEGVDPASYTATILRRLNSYIHRLRLAQERVTVRLPWSDPVPSYHRQPRSSLDYHYWQRQSNTVPHGWPTIDLITGAVSHCASESTGSASKPATHSRRRRKTETPVKSSHSQKRKILCADDDDSEQCCVPDQTSPLKRWSRSTVPANSATPAPPTQPPDDHTPPPLQSPSRGHVAGQPVDSELHSCSVLPDQSRDTTADHPSSNTAGILVPPASSSGSRETVETEIGTTGGSTSGLGTTAPCGDSEGEEGDEVIGINGSRKRRRMSHILDDSEPEEEAEDVAKNSSGSDAINSAVSSGEVGADSANLAAEGSGQGSVSLSTSAQTAFVRGKRLKRFSFQRLPVTVVRHSTSEQGASASGGEVIDLTEDALVSATTRDATSSPSESPTPSSPHLPRSSGRTLRTKRTRARRRAEQQAGDEEGAEGERVPCPLCGESFAVSVIEAHAAGCLEPREPSPVLERPSVRRNSTLRQSSLLTPRYKKQPRVLSSSPSLSPEPSASWHPTLQNYSGQEEEEEEEGDEADEGGQSSDQESTAAGPRVYECEGGGYQVDPTTVSSSPIKSFRRITDLEPGERSGFYNQFNKRRRGGSRGQRGEGDAAWGRSEFSEMMGDYMSSRRGRGGGRGGTRGKRKGKRRFFKRRGK